VKPAFLRNFQPGASKYSNKKVEVDGILFDSKKEAKVYVELKQAEARGEILDLRRQVTFTLLPSQYINGKCVERPLTYIADFVVEHPDGEVVVIDCKGFRDTVYRIKKKLMLHFHRVQIKEV